MTTSKKLQSTLANAGGGGLNVEDVFSTYLYTGNGSTQTITNDIDLDGEGGLVWLKDRDSAYANTLFDTERGATYGIRSNTTEQQYLLSTSLTGFNTNGFSLGSYSNTNFNGNSIASWTFRKAPKFFDVVTYTGNGTNNHEIAHSLGTDIGALIIKRTDSTGDWYVWHRSYGSNYSYQYLNETDLAITDSTIFRNIYFDTDSFTLGTSNGVNASGGTYVAYLFAHNDDDGEFGESGDQDIIKCGSYTGGVPQDIDLGFEPQWLLTKNATSSNDWRIWDNMRGVTTGDVRDVWLYPNLSNAEGGGNEYVAFNSTGFTLESAHGSINGASNTYIYVAIRRPMKTPESGTEVFAIDTYGSTGDAKAPAFRVGFPVDMALATVTSGADRKVMSRLIQGKQLLTNSTAAETSESGNTFDYMNGHVDGTGTQSNYYSWMFKRAPGFFDVVCYEGDGTAGRTVDHNLGVAPEMIWVKNRTYGYNWFVYHKGLNVDADNLPETDVIRLNMSIAAYDDVTIWNDTAPTDTIFSLGSGQSNASSQDYIAYLFATLPGISKVGSYTGNGTSQTIDCGFSTGARFVLIKSTGVQDWHVFDTERGIISGNDPRLELNTDSAEQTNSDFLNPDSSGFAVTSDTAVNNNGTEYIFLAIA
mgnify:CR=1 FL=1